MYFDQSTRSDSSDESLFLQKNVQITLKDISKQQKVSLEQSENHQYLTNSYEELTSAIEKEKLKSILVKGNTTSRRKPPPPPAGNQQTLPEFTRNRETKFTLNRANLKKSDPPKHHQYFEWIDDSPLTSPENIKFARENISKLLKEQNSQKELFRRQLPPAPVEVRSIRVSEQQSLDQPHPVPKLRPTEVEHQSLRPPSHASSKNYPELDKRISKLEQRNDLWKQQVNQYIQLSSQFDKVAESLQECTELESLTSCLSSITSALRSCFRLSSLLFYSLDSRTPYSGKRYSRGYQDPESGNNAVWNFELEQIVPFLAQSYSGFYKVIKSSERIFSDLMKFLIPTEETLKENASIYILELAHEENSSFGSKKYPHSIMFIIFEDLSLVNGDEDYTMLAQFYLQDTLRTLRCYLENTIIRIHSHLRDISFEFRENEIILENEIRKYLHQAHYDFVLRVESESDIDRYSQYKLQSLIFSLTQLPLKFFQSPFSWIILQNHQTSETGPAVSFFHIFNSIGECRTSTENYLNLYERYSTHLSHHFGNSLGKLVLGAGLSEQNIAKPAIITTSLDVLYALGLLADTFVENFSTTIQLLIIPFTLSELNPMADYSAFVIALPTTSALSHDFILEQSDLIIEMLLKCISLSRNHTQRNIIGKLNRSCDEIISEVLVTKLDSPENIRPDRRSNMQYLMKTIRMGYINNAFRATAAELLIPKDLHTDTGELDYKFLGLLPSDKDDNLMELIIDEVNWMKTLIEGHPVVISNLQSRNRSSLIQYINAVSPNSKFAILFPIVTSKKLSILILIDILVDRMSIEGLVTETQTQTRLVLNSSQCENSLNSSYISPSLHDMIALIEKSNCLKILQNVLQYCMSDDQYVTETSQFFSKSKVQHDQLQQQLQKYKSLQLKSRYFGFWKTYFYRNREIALTNQVTAYCQAIDSFFHSTSTIHESELRQNFLMGVESIFAGNNQISLTVKENLELSTLKSSKNGDVYANIVDDQGHCLLSIKITSSSSSKPLKKFEIMLVEVFSKIGSFILQSLPKYSFRDFSVQTDLIEEDPIQSSFIPFLNKFLPILFPKDLLAIEDFSQIMSYSSRFQLLSQEIIHYITDISHADIGLLRIGYVPEGLQYISKDTVFSSEDPRLQQLSPFNDLQDVVEGTLNRSDRKKRGMDNQLTLKLFGINGELQLFRSELPLTQREQQFASIVSYFLIASSCFHDLKERYFKLQQTSHSQDQDQRKEINEIQKALDIAEESLEYYEEYHSFLKNFISFTLEILRISTIEKLNNEICSHLPAFLGIKSIALYVRHDEPRGAGGGNGGVEYRLLLPTGIQGAGGGGGAGGGSGGVEYRLLLPLGIQEGGGPGAGGGGEYENIITENQMRKFPTYDLNNPHNTQQLDYKMNFTKKSKILLIHPQVPYPLGFLLISEEDSHQLTFQQETLFMKSNPPPTTTTPPATASREDSIILKYLFEIIIMKFNLILYFLEKDKNIIQNYTPSQQYHDLEMKYESLHDLHNNLQEELHKNIEIIKILHIDKDNLIKKIEILHQDFNKKYEDLHVQYESLQADYETNQFNHQQYKLQIENEYQLLNNQYHDITNSYKILETMIMSYTSDSRFQVQQLLSWLDEIADNLNLTIIPIHRNNRGEYYFSSKFNNIEGIVSTTTGSISLQLSNAIRESLRSYSPIEIIGTQNEIFSIKSNTKGLDFQNKLLITILCVPNRLVGNGLVLTTAADHYYSESTSRECICYLFLRNNDMKFTEYEKSYLNCAVGLVSKCLGVYTVAKRSYPENIEELLQKTEIEKAITMKIRETIEFSVKFCSQIFNSWNEFVIALENIGNSVLLRTQSTPTGTSSSTSSTNKSSYVIDGYVWQPGTQNNFNEYVRSNFESIRGGLEMDAIGLRVISNGKILRNGNVMWIPLKLSSGNTVALLYLEKKIDLRQDKDYRSRFGSEERKKSSSSDPLVDDTQTISIPKDDLLFTEIDEEIMNFFSILVVTPLDRLVHQRETLQSIQTASKAIVTLQQSITKLENGLANEISQRLKLEETMKIGSEILTSALLQRLDISSIVDQMRRGIKTATSSLECMLLTPNLYEGITQSIDGNLVYKDHETGSIHEVTLDPMQMESIAYRTRKPLRLSNMSSDTECWILQNILSGNINSSININEENLYYVLVVPCLIHDIGLILAIVIRSDRDYDGVDEMVMTWLTKIFSLIISYKKEIFYYEEQKIKFIEIEKDHVDKNSQLENILLELSGKLQHTSSEENQDHDDDDDMQRVDQPTRSEEQLIKEFSKTFEFMLSGNTTSTSTSTFDTLLPKEEEGLKPLEILQQLLHIFFPYCHVGVQTPMESLEQINTILLLEDPSTSTSIRRRKDSILYENFKFIYWEEFNQNTSAGITGTSSITIRGLLTLHSLSDTQLWITIKQDSYPPLTPLTPTSSSTSTMEFNYYYYYLKLKFLIIFQIFFIIIHLSSYHLTAIKTSNGSYQELLKNHQEEIHNLLQENSNNKEKYIKDINEILLEKNLNFEKYSKDLSQMKQKYKTYLQDKILENKYSEEFILYMNEAQQYLQNLLISYQHTSSSTGSTSAGTSSSNKPLNINKIIRKVCDSLNTTGIIDIAAAIVSPELVPSNEKILSSNFPANYLSWITSSTNWIHTNSPLSSSNPIAMSFIMKKFILIVHTEEKKKNILEELSPNLLEDWVIVVHSLFSDLTVILPIIGKFDKNSYLFVGKLITQGSISIKLLLNTWSSFLGTLVSLSKYKYLESSTTTITREIKLKICLINAIKRFNISDYQHISHAFYHMKSLWIQSRGHTRDLEVIQYKEAKHQIRILERSLADWTELTKGINGACGGISNGLPGLWSRACRPLMSILASHVTLLSCGLLVASDEETVLDLNVEELSTHESYTSKYENHEGIEANIALRPAAEVGSSLQSLAWSILNGQSWRGDPQLSQRLWRLTKRSVNDTEEQMWLVPVRTSTEVLGILRVTVEVPLANIERNRLIEYGRYIEEEGDEYSWTGGNIESAKRNLLNFSELFASLVTATRMIETYKSQDDSYNMEINELIKRESKLKSETENLRRTIHLIEKSLSVILNASYQELSDDEISLGAFSVLSTRLSNSLSSVFDFTISISSTETPEMNTVIPSKPISYPILIDGVEVCYLFAHVPTSIEDLSIIYHEEETTQHLQQERFSIFNDETVYLILKILSNPISSFFITISKEINLKNMITTAVANLHNLQHQVDDLKIEKDDLLYREVISLESNSFNSDLYYLMKEFTLGYEGFDYDWTDTAEIESQTTPSPDRPPPHHHELSSNHQILISKIINRLQKMFQDRCIFNFAIIWDETVTQSDQILWYNEEKGKDYKLKLPNGLDANSKTISLLRNLAFSTIENESNSSVDIELSSSDSSSSSSTILRILTYPLLLLPPSDTQQKKKKTKNNNKKKISTILGVLQVYSLSIQSIERSLLEKVCYEVVHAMSNFLNYELSLKKFLQYIHNTNTSNNILQITIEDLSKELLNLKKKHDLWKEICHLSRSFYEEQDIHEILKQIKNNNNIGLYFSFNQMNHQNQYEKYFQQKLIIDDGGSNEVYLSVDTEFLSDEEIIQVIESINKIIEIRNIIFSNKQNIKQQEKIIHTLKHDHEIISEKCQQLAHDLEISSRTLSQQTDTIIQIKKQFLYNFDNNLHLIIENILYLLQQIPITLNTSEDTTNPPPPALPPTHPHHPHQQGVIRKFNFTVEQTEQYFTYYARSINIALSKFITTPNSTYHSSILVKTRLDNTTEGSQFSDGIVIFDGTSQMGKMISDHSLIIDPSRGIQSAVYQCFHTSRIQQYEDHDLFNLHGLDLIGITGQQLHSFSTSTGGISQDQVSICILTIPLISNINNLVSIIRIIYIEEKDNNFVDNTSRSNNSTSTSTSILLMKQGIETLTQFSEYFTQSFYQSSLIQTLEIFNKKQKQDFQQKFHNLQNQFIRYRKIYRNVLHEISTFFDYPLVEQQSIKGLVHPVSLSPSIALHDTCMKTLLVIHKICQTNGQGILLQDFRNSNENFKLLYTGNGISWTGIDEGIISPFHFSFSHSSLLSNMLQKHKTIVIKDYVSDKDYNPSIDGHGSSGSNLLLTPLRGKGNIIIGALIVTKVAPNNIFTPEDVTAIELIATISSLCLYWGDGSSFLHQKLSNTILKMEELESSVKILKQNTKR